MASGSLPNDPETNTLLTYLGLPIDYEPSPTTAPVPFLAKHLGQLPSHLSHIFSAITTPRERTVVLLIRNRRFNFTQSDPPELRFPAAKRQWPMLWQGAEHVAGEDAREEKEWADTTFLGGKGNAFVGKLGMLLGDYEEERQIERARQAKRGLQDVLTPDSEEDERSDDDDDDDLSGPGTPESAKAMQELFLRRVREQFIYGQLEWDLYDTIDWDDSWDREDRDAEDRWFDDDE